MAVTAYRGDFKALLIGNPPFTPSSTIYVLINQPNRLFLENQQQTQIFGNIFVVNDVMIFKGLSNYLFSPCRSLTSLQISTGYLRENQWLGPLSEVSPTCVTIRGSPAQVIVLPIRVWAHPLSQLHRNLHS